MLSGFFHHRVTQSLTEEEFKRRLTRIHADFIFFICANQGLSAFQ